MKRVYHDLEKRARTLRLDVLETVARTGKGHIGGTYSCLDLFVALYYGGILKFDAANPKWKDRDRFLVGKGHACLPLYYIWADLGFFDKKLISEFGEDGGSLGGQLDLTIPGAEHNTGSLGHALGVGAGIALAAKLDRKDFKTLVLLGDAECDEGAIWESMDFSATNELGNLVAIIDRNRLSVIDFIDDHEGTLQKKIEAFGWDCKSINGHSFEDIFSVFDSEKKQDTPLMIIANTIKGKGVSFMENNPKWHQSAMTPDEINQAKRELMGVV